MNYTADMLTKFTDDLSIPQKEELESIFKSGSDISNAHYSNYEEALKSQKGIIDITTAIDTFLFFDRYKYSAFFEVDNPQNIPFDILLSRMPVKTKKNSEAFYLNDENLVFTRLNNEFGLYYIVDYRDEAEGNNIIRNYFNGVLVCFHNEVGRIFCEICLSDLRLIYRSGDPEYFYTTINLLKNMVSKYIQLNLNGLDLKELIFDLSNDKSLDYVVYTGSNMHTDKRAQATLMSGKSKNFVIPILGDLEVFLEENTELLHKNSDTLLILHKLEEFIADLKNNSHYTWINLTWGLKTLPKNKLIEVKYLFENSYTLLSYFSHNLGRGGMRYATERLLDEFVKKQTAVVFEGNESVV
ncbi:hypothetical protein [Enterococcus gallinarum]|uniref:hypothetical protein n=1 Tax=Enterococcus gallinarum TaxID=1353 RepID=UPI003D6B0E66